MTQRSRRGNREHAHARVGGAVTAVTLVLASLSAYALTRLGIRGGRGMVYGVLATRMVPILILLIPLYVGLRRLHLLDSLVGVVVTEAGFFLPYAIWIMMALNALVMRRSTVRIRSPAPDFRKLGAMMGEIHRFNG